MTEQTFSPYIHLTAGESRAIVNETIRAANDAYTALGESLIPDIDRPAATAAVKRAHAAYLRTCANVRTLWNSLLSWPRPESAASDYETACAHSEDARAAAALTAARPLAATPDQYAALTAASAEAARLSKV